jgi:hypothetical protein
MIAYLALSGGLNRDQFRPIVAGANDPNCRYPASSIFWSLQLRSNRIFSAKLRWIPGRGRLRKMLLQDIPSELLPVLRRVAHLGEESRLISASVMSWIENIISKLTRVYPRQFGVRKTVSHARIITYPYLQGRDRGYSALADNI